MWCWKITNILITAMFCWFVINSFRLFKIPALTIRRHCYFAKHVFLKWRGVPKELTSRKRFIVAGFIHIFDQHRWIKAKVNYESSTVYWAIEVKPIVIVNAPRARPLNPPVPCICHLPIWCLWHHGCSRVVASTSTNRATRFLTITRGESLSCWYPLTVLNS